jgi:hypothetical protein
VSTVLTSQDDVFRHLAVCVHDSSLLSFSPSAVATMGWREPAPFLAEQSVLVHSEVAVVGFVLRSFHFRNA